MSCCAGARRRFWNTFTERPPRRRRNHSPMTLPQTAATSVALPLTGCRVLVSRAQQQADALSSALRNLGCQVIEIPFIEIRDPQSYEPLNSALRNLANYDWLILTSVNGVDALFRRMTRKRVDKSALANLKIAAIGPATRRAIERHGLEVTITPKEYIAESVVAALRDQVKSKRVLLVRAKVARDVIPLQLCKAGAQVEVVEAYETVVPKSSQELLRAVLSNEKRPHAITFTSSSTVRNFVSLLGLRGARSVCPWILRRRTTQFLVWWMRSLRSERASRKREAGCNPSVIDPASLGML